MPDYNPIPVSTSLGHVNKAGRFFRKKKSSRRVLYLSLQAMINALFIGFVAKLLVMLIACVTNLAFHSRFSFAPAAPSVDRMGYWVILIPVIGGLLVGVMARFGSEAIRGHGIPEAMEKIMTGESKIPPITAFLKPLSAAISIGTGGPFGAEGPIIATGGAFGSLTGQIMHISASERKTILAAGACSGMAAIFGTPFAALLLAIELLLFEYSSNSIIPVSIACVTGAAMHFLLFDQHPVFQMHALPIASGSVLFIYVLLGAIVGVFASLVSKSIYTIEELFEKIPIHWMWWPALGALVVGVVGFFYPQTMGVGYDNITTLLTGTAGLKMLLVLGLFKYISWSVALGSGTSGGTLAPLLTIGGALGAFLAFGMLQFFPESGIDTATCALIGMAAMFAGASRALLTSIAFALEATGQINGLLPLLGACVAAYFVSFLFMRNSIMTEKIERRGIQTPDAYTPDVLRLNSVQQLITPNPLPGKSIPAIFATDDIGLAAEMMGKYGETMLLVLDNEESMKELGVITSQSVLAFYSEYKEKETAYNSPAITRRLMVHGRNLIRRFDERM